MTNSGLISMTVHAIESIRSVASKYGEWRKIKFLIRLLIDNDPEIAKILTEYRAKYGETKL